MRLAEIMISTNNILQTYTSLPERYKEVVEALFNEISQNNGRYYTYYTVRVDNFINRRGNNNLNVLHELNLNNKVGDYIFAKELNEERCEPVYVGFSGDGRQSLLGRLQKQLTGNNCSTLASNIRDIESLLQDNPHIRYTNPLKLLISQYTTYIITIITGELGDNNAVEDAKNLERVLIALLRPKYNR